jgi:hypothetical protein
MAARGKALPDRRPCRPLVEPRQRVLGPGNGRKQRLERCGIYIVAHC